MRRDYKMEEYQGDIGWDGNNNPKFQKEKEQEMDNTRNVGEDRIPRDERPEGQDA